MSSDHDPTQYGMVRFGKGKDSPAARPDPDAGVPEKLPVQGNAPPPAAPPSVVPLVNRHPKDDEGDGWAPLEEIPGEEFSDPLASAPTVIPQSTAPPAPPSSPTPSPSPGSGSVPAAKPDARRRPEPSPRPRGKDRVNPSAAPGAPAYPFVLHNRPAQWVVPLVVLNLGIAVGAVMFLFYQSLPLGGIAAMLGVIGGLFTRIFLRESI